MYFFIYVSDVGCYAVHIFGDSHAYFCFSNQNRGPFDEQSIFCMKFDDSDFCVPFYIHHLGPITMHRVGRDGFGILDIRNYIKDGDTVVFSFGEIDVRCHIGKQRDAQGRSADEVVKALVSNYLKTIRENVDQYKKLDVVILGPVPPSDIKNSPFFKPYGSLSERILLNSLLNETLQEEIKKRGFYYLDIRDLFQNSEGSFETALSDGSVHVGIVHNRVIKERLFSLVNKVPNSHRNLE